MASINPRLPGTPPRTNPSQANPEGGPRALRRQTGSEDLRGAAAPQPPHIPGSQDLPPGLRHRQGVEDLRSVAGTNPPPSRPGNPMIHDRQFPGAPLPPPPEYTPPVPPRVQPGPANQGPNPPLGHQDPNARPGTPLPGYTPREPDPPPYTLRDYGAHRQGTDFYD